VLGAFQLGAGGTVIARGLRRKAAELLVYLVLHPDGATSHELLDALWPDTSQERAFPILHAATSNIRSLLRSATRTPESAFIVRVGDRMRIDAREISSDLWRFQGALATAASAADDGQRAEALEEAAGLWRGDFADGMDSVWIEEHRETLRRDAVDALARLAELYEESEPERALASLERAITIDRYQEALYQRIMMVQARLGRRDASRRTCQLLESRLADIDAEPEEATARLLHQIPHGDGT
jgi:DNA-binding SARP family transcriptional activator